MIDSLESYSHSLALDTLNTTDRDLNELLDSMLNLCMKAHIMEVDLATLFLPDHIMSQVKLDEAYEECLQATSDQPCEELFTNTDQPELCEGLFTTSAQPSEGLFTTDSEAAEAVDMTNSATGADQMNVVESSGSTAAAPTPDVEVPELTCQRDELRGEDVRQASQSSQLQQVQQLQQLQPLQGSQYNAMVTTVSQHTGYPGNQLQDPQVETSSFETETKPQNEPFDATSGDPSSETSDMIENKSVDELTSYEQFRADEEQNEVATSGTVSGAVSGDVSAMQIQGETEDAAAAISPEVEQNMGGEFDKTVQNMI